MIGENALSDDGGAKNGSKNLEQLLVVVGEVLKDSEDGSLQLSDSFRRALMIGNSENKESQCPEFLRPALFPPEVQAEASLAFRYRMDNIRNNHVWAIKPAYKSLVMAFDDFQRSGRRLMRSDESLGQALPETEELEFDEPGFASKIGPLYQDLHKSLTKSKIVNLLNTCGESGILYCLGHRRTVGTTDYVCPPVEHLIESFNKIHAGKLTVGARAFTKHCGRTAESSWWGENKGSEPSKNMKALEKLLYILEHAVWINCHCVPSGHGDKQIKPVIEIRCQERFGARWYVTDRDQAIVEFRGFVDPGGYYSKSKAELKIDMKKLRRDTKADLN